jgi:hemolysin III
MAANPPPVPVKPALRGVSHEIAAYLALPSALLLVAAAPRGTPTTAAAVYAGSLVFLFSTSAFYHRPFWAPRARALMGRIDHAAIFLLIAGTYTPFCLLLGPALGRALLAFVWTAAAGGVLFSLLWAEPPKKVMAGIYVLYGWTIVPVVPALRAVGDGTLALLLVGGFFYSVGAAVYAYRRPDPLPRVFGYHEIFHLLVIAAAVCHYLVVAAVVGTLG